MKIPDLSIIEKTLNNEATSRSLVRLFVGLRPRKDRHGLLSVSIRMRKRFIWGGRGMDRPSDTLSRNVSEYYAATPPTKNTPFYSVCGCGLYTDRFNYRTFHTHKLTSGFVGGLFGPSDEGVRT